MVTRRTYHVSGAADDGGEDGPRRVVSREPSLAHPRPVVDHEGSYLIFHSCDFLTSSNTKLKCVNIHMLQRSHFVHKLNICHFLHDKPNIAYNLSAQHLQNILIYSKAEAYFLKFLVF